MYCSSAHLSRFSCRFSHFGSCPLCGLVIHATQFFSRRLEFRPKCSVLVSSDQRILFFLLWHFLRCLFDKIQAGCHVHQVVFLYSSPISTKEHWSSTFVIIGFWVASLIKDLLLQLLSLFEQPDLGRVLLVTNFFFLFPNKGDICSGIHNYERCSMLVEFLLFYSASCPASRIVNWWTSIKLKNLSDDQRKSNELELTFKFNSKGYEDLCEYYA